MTVQKLRLPPRRRVYRNDERSAPGLAITRIITRFALLADTCAQRRTAEAADHHDGHLLLITSVINRVTLKSNVTGAPQRPNTPVVVHRRKAKRHPLASNAIHGRVFRS